jgi:hypothetical protein
MISKNTFAMALVVATLPALASAAEPKVSAAGAKIRFAPGVEAPSLRGKKLTTFVVKAEPRLTLEAALERGGPIVDYTQSGIAVDPRSVEADGSVLRFRDPEDASAALEFTVDRRKLFFNRGLLPYREEEETSGLPSEQEALPLVERHLHALGFLPPKEETQPPSIGGLNLAVKREDGTTSVYRKLVRVRFDRTLAGLPVEGGSRVVALLGEHGRLVSLAWNWPLVEGREVERTELTTATQHRRAILARLRRDLPTAREILVEKADLVLFDRDGVIEPAVRLQAQATYLEKVVNGQKGETRLFQQPYDTVIPLLRKPKARYPFVRDKEAARLVKRDSGRSRPGLGE